MHARVGSYRAIPFGLHDTHGNVWEWCLDGFEGGEFSEKPATNPVAPRAGSAQRMVRGGSLFEPAASVRTAYRTHSAPGVRSVTLGVRPAREIAP